MFTRRRFFSLVASGPIALSVLPCRFQVGDIVRVVKDRPAVRDAWHPELVEFNRQRRLCYGKTCRVLYVGDDGRPELDVSEHVIPFVPVDPVHGPPLGCVMAFEPDCLALVKRGEPFQMPEWAV